MHAPGPGEVEANIFGPGFGEAALVHLGDNNWLIIDSCIDSRSGQPAPLRYLQEIGVDAASAVKLIVVSHWHDDHIRGLAQTVETCREARLCVSPALSRSEFIATIAPYEERNFIKAGSGVRELIEALKILGSRRQSATRALPNRLIFRLPGQSSGHGHEVGVTTLSPSDRQFELSLAEIGSLMPETRETKRRAPSQRENHLSVVTWVKIGEECSLLLGGDLEERGHPALGWSAILSLDPKPTGRASFFKVPHHGSITGHHDQVWQELLEPDAHAVLTPWGLGSKLPKQSDVHRITSLTSHSFATSTPDANRSRAFRIPAVERTVRESSVKLRAAQPPMGHVRVRRVSGAWQTELYGNARVLADLVVQ